MRADIIEFSNQHFYEGRLRIATKYDRLRRPATDAQTVSRVPRAGRGGSSGEWRLNEIKAKAVVKELEMLCIEQGYSGTVGVVTPFRAQAKPIRDLSNVAITHTRAALIVVGDSAAKNAGVTYLAAFANYVETLGRNPHQQTGRPCGACSGPHHPKIAKPDMVSDWERVFYRKLWEAGLRPIPQYAEEEFLLDFALLAEAIKLNIEVDGERYHRDWNGGLLQRDQLCICA